MTLAIRAHDSIHAFDDAAWEALVAHTRGATPFVYKGFLSALEDAGTVGGRTGWRPHYLAAYAPEAADVHGAGATDATGSGQPERLVGVALGWVKAHSMGEFVHDWGWAEAAQRAGIAYYPKLVLAVPFTPAVGARLLVDARLGDAGVRDVRRALLEAATASAEALGCSSVHVLFALAEEIDAAAELGFHTRLGCQFHWQDEGYADFEAFLGRFDSKRRNQIRRERRRVREAGVTVHARAGHAIGDELVGPAHALYGVTVDRYPWGRRYLNRDFFELLWQRMRPALQLLVATRGAGPAPGEPFDPGAIVGGSVNLQGLGEGGALRRWGRYWGALADVDALHFEVCSYAAIDDCIRTGVAVFEAGAGGGEHKLGRGFMPFVTRSAHRVFDSRFHAAVGDFCAREAVAIEADMARLAREVFAR